MPRRHRDRGASGLFDGDLDNGRYEPRGEIGRGAMGVVYRAWDRRLEKEVALKVLESGTVTDDLARDSFRKEARFLGMLDQTRIARIQDFFEHAGRDVIVMEYVEGETLSARLKKGPLPEREVVRLGVQLCEGLAAAHRKGLLHRDLKPSNLCVNRDGDLKILDFGVAKLWKQDPDPPPAASRVLHRTGDSIHDASGFVGTYPYFSPEQLRGRNVDVRADLYAAGAVLYEMATGRQIFADSPLDRLADAIEKDRPVPLRHLGNGISRSLERVIHRALEKESRHRFGSALEMRQALLRTRWRRWAGWASAATAVLGLAVAFRLDAFHVHGRLFPVAEPGSVRLLAVLPFENATGDAALDDWCAGLGRELIQAASRAYEVAVLAPATSRRLRGRAPRDVGRERGVQAVVVGRVLRRDSSLAVEATVLDPMAWRPLARLPARQASAAGALLLARGLLRDCAETLALRPRNGGPGVLGRLRAVDPRALDAYFAGCAWLERPGVEGCARAVQLLQRAVEVDSTFAPAWAALARATYALPTDRLPLQDAADGAERAAWRALAADPDLPDPYVVLACIDEFHRDEPESAKLELDRALALDPHHALARRLLGIAHLRRGRFNEADVELQRAWELDPLRDPGLDVLWQHSGRAEYDSVLARGNRLLHERPDDWEAYVVLAHATQSLGDGPQADYLVESGRQRLVYAIPKSVMAACCSERPAAAPARAPAPGTVYVADASALDGRGAVLGLDPETGAQWVVAAGEHLSNPTGIAVDSDGSLLVVWQASRRLLRVDPRTGQQTVVSAAPRFIEPCQLVLSPAGDIYLTDWHLWPPGFVYRIEPSTGAPVVVVSGKSLINPAGITPLPDGDLAVGANVTDTGRGCVYRVRLTGAWSVLASGGWLAQPFGVRVGPEGALYVADYSAFDGGGGVIRVDLRTGSQSVVARGGDFVDPIGLDFTAAGDLMVADFDLNRPRGKVLRIDPAAGTQRRVYSGGMLVRPFSLAVFPGSPPPAPADLIVEGPMKLTHGRFDTIRIEAGAVLNVAGRLDVRGDVVVAGDAELVCSGSLAAGGDLILEPGARLTHAARHLSGAGLEIGGTLEVCAGASIDVSARGLYGGSAATQFRGETFDSRGAVVLEVTGGLQGGSGASHGGDGGRDTAGGVSNAPYGSEARPAMLGSGGGGARGGAGGGRIAIRARRCVVDGRIRADGDAGRIYREEIGGGGSGGSILVVARELTGAGRIEARGGAGSRSYGWGGGGGGGRIALYADKLSIPPDHLSVAGGPSRIPGRSGTIRTAPFGRARPPR
jgi:tRNA A-37 threonylcarbamoyl transferase component Bud32/DNA-binding beta-propeller fold protein YncE/TolB-like protein